MPPGDPNIGSGSDVPVELCDRNLWGPAYSHDPGDILRFQHRPGAWIARYAYDGLGRLICKTTPVTPGAADPGQRREHYYYDGVRRIREMIEREPDVVVLLTGGDPNNAGDPNLWGDPNVGGWAGSGTPPDPNDLPPGDPNDPEYAAAAAAAAGVEEPAEIVPLDPLPALVISAYPANWSHRDYVWGPDYVDELVAVFDRAGKCWYALTDGNYNVVALARGNHVDSSKPLGQVVEQRVYEPYGALLNHDILSPDAPIVPVGHQGLFFDRFDGVQTDRAITPMARGVYETRNRIYLPRIGRWGQRDVNETAAPILTALAFNAASIHALMTGFDLASHYGDGANLWTFSGNNPVGRRDPLGLIYDPFEDVDDWVADRTGHAIATLGVLADASALGLSVGVSILSSFIPGAGIYDAYQQGVGLFEGEVGFWDYVAFGVAALPIAGKIASKAIQWARKAYAAGRVEMRVSSVSLRVLQKLCFAAGTAVALADGSQVPIESVRVGDRVMSWPDPGQDDAASIEISADAWLIAHLQVTKCAGCPARVSLLRPVGWLREQVAGAADLCDGESFWLSLATLGLAGVAEVVAIEPCPAWLEGPATGLVTATVSRQSERIVDIGLAEQSEPLCATPEHPFWSVDRARWMPAGALSPDERIRTLSGVTTVLRVESRREGGTVYNLEIAGDHTYFVSKAAVWVHNTYVAPGPGAWNRLQRSPHNTRGLSTHEISANFHRAKQRGGGLRPVHSTRVDDVTGDVINHTEGSDEFGEWIGNVFEP